MNTALVCIKLLCVTSFVFLSPITCINLKQNEPRAPVQKQQTSKLINQNEDVPLVEFMCVVLSGMPGELP